MGNHGDAVSTVSLDPPVEYLRGALSICGHEVTVGWETIRPDAVNLLFEYFVDRSVIENIVSMRRRSSIRLGIVTTDLIVQSSIPDAEFSMPLGANLVPDRIQGFETLAREVDFIWSWLQRTSDEARRHNPVSEYFPVGHVAEVPAKLRRSPRDIEVLFLGMRTPHRDRVLHSLGSQGLKVVPVGQGFPTEHLSHRMVESLIDRSKIALNLNLVSESEITGVDPRFASGMRIVGFLERDTSVVSEETPLDNPYKEYMQSAEPEALAETCRAVLSNDRWLSAGRDCAARFREAMDVAKICGPVVARTLAAMNLR